MKKTLSTLLAGLAIGLAASPATHAAAPMVGTQAPGYYRMVVGAAEVTAVSDGTVMTPFDKLLTNTTPERVNALLARSHLTPNVETSINAFLVNTGTHLVLVDTGAGTSFGPGVAGKLQASIRAAGYRAEDVDAVLITHIHGDHSNGLAQDGKMLFPNATVYVNRHDTDFWLNPANKAKVAPDQRNSFGEAPPQFAPYQAAGKLKTFDGETELVPGIRALPATGHTPGHTVYALKSGGQELRFWGDMLHVKDVQFAAPEVTIRFDVDSPAAERQREAAFADAAARGYLVACAHTPFPGIGYVRKDGKAYDWLPVPYTLQTRPAAQAGR
jgi:glyoxylase-like metal-dependent hydrolase (beta-lactamase superfamily II)